MFGGKATLREIEIRYDLFGKQNPLPIRVLLVLPNDRKGRCPVFVGPNFTGNHSFVTDPKVRLPDVWMPDRMRASKDNKATEAGRGKAARTSGISNRRWRRGTRSPRSTAATFSPTGRTCARGCGPRCPTRTGGHGRRDRDDHVVGVGRVTARSITS